MSTTFFIHSQYNPLTCLFWLFLLLGFVCVQNIIPFLVRHVVELLKPLTWQIVNSFLLDLCTGINSTRRINFYQIDRDRKRRFRASSYEPGAWPSSVASSKVSLVFLFSVSLRAVRSSRCLTPPLFFGEASNCVNMTFHFSFWQETMIVSCF